MARIKLPCFSTEAHGKIAGVLVFATNRWGQYAKILAPKRYTNTEAQKKVRHAYGQIGQFWRTMTEEQKEVYSPGAKKLRIGRFHYFFKVVWPDFYNLEYSSTLSKAILNKNYLGFSGW